MKFFKKYTTWIAAFIFACAVIFVYKTFDNIAEIVHGIGSVLSTVLSAFKPFFIAFVIAYILNMPARKLNSLFAKCKNKFIKNHSHGLSVGGSYIVAAIIVAVIISAILPIFYTNVVEFFTNLPNYISSAENFINNSELMEKLDIFNINKIDILSKLYDEFSGMIDTTQLGKYAQGVVSFTSGIFDMFIAIVASIYMLLDKERIKSASKKALSVICNFFMKRKKNGKTAVKNGADTADRIILHMSTINDVFVNYIYSRLICGIITGFFCAVILSIFRVKYAALLGIIIVVLDMIPYFGSIIASVFSIAITLLTSGFWKAVWTAVTLIVVQQVDGNILSPKIMGDSLKIRPLWIILAVTVGGSLFGFWGMLISVPIVAAVKAVYADWKENAAAKKSKETLPDDGDAESLNTDGGQSE